MKEIGGIIYFIFKLKQIMKILIILEFSINGSIEIYLKLNFHMDRF